MLGLKLIYVNKMGPWNEPIYGWYLCKVQGSHFIWKAPSMSAVSHAICSSRAWCVKNCYWRWLLVFNNRVTGHWDNCLGYNDCYTEDLQIHNPTWKIESYHDANFVITGGTACCLLDNLQCHQWWQSWHHGDYVFSVIPSENIVINHNELCPKRNFADARSCHI